MVVSAAVVEAAVVSAVPLSEAESLPQLAATTEMKTIEATTRERRSWRSGLIMERTVPDLAPASRGSTFRNPSDHRAGQVVANVIGVASKVAEL